MTEERIDTWAVIELMGHRKVAGRVSERNIGGSVLLQVDIPGADGQIARSELYGLAAIYGIHPTTEEALKRIIANRPWGYNEPIIPYVPPERQLASGDHDPDPDDDRDYDPDDDDA